MIANIKDVWVSRSIIRLGQSVHLANVPANNLAAMRNKSKVAFQRPQY